MKIDNAIILAAGNSTRFGENKLLKKINGLSLPQRCIKFCIKNNIQNVYVTLRKDDLYFDDTNTKIVHPIMKDLNEAAVYTEPVNFPGLENFTKLEKIKIKYEFQDINEYGAVAGIKPFSSIHGNTIVLFGDNYYGCNLNFDSINLDDDTIIVSCLRKTTNPRNLQLAVIKDEYVIEKPHAELSGMFFCGYIIFNEKGFKHILDIKKSNRNEYEISDFINAFSIRKFVNIDEFKWADLTYQNDIEKIEKLISENIF